MGDGGLRMLVLEDESGLADFLRRGLEEEGHRVTPVGSLAEARAELGDAAYDLLLLDRRVPDGDGLDLLRDLRGKGVATPAIFLTARDRVDDRVEGLVGGADDYLVKPFSFEELLARIASVTRRTHVAAKVLTVADLTLDPDAARVTRAGREVRLTAQEYRLLRYFMENEGRVLSRSRLLQDVWDLRFDPGTNVVDVYVSYLRARIDRGFDDPLIHTVRGLGYVLEARPR